MMTVKWNPQIDKVFRALVDDHLNITDAGRKLGKSKQAVSKQKDNLLEAGIISPIGDAGLYERGPNVKFFEKASRVTPEVKESTISKDKSCQPCQPPTVDGGAVEGVPSAGTHAERILVPEIEAHMHNGGVIFPIEHLGRVNSYNQNGKEVPFFTKEKFFNNCWQYDIPEFRLPGKDWTAPLQLQVFTPKNKPRHSHLRIFPARVSLTVDEADAGKTYPAQFFEKDIFEILDHIEKHAGWKFYREEGRRVGRKDGQVVYAMRIPDELKAIIPPNFQGVEGVDMHADASPGKGKQEIESKDYDRIEAIARAKEHFEEVNEDIKDVQSWAAGEIARIEKEAENQKVRIGQRILSIYTLLDMTTAAQEKMVESQHIEVERSMLVSIPMPVAEAQAGSQDTKDRYGGMYR